MRRSLAVAMLVCLLAACADEPGPSFAPDAASETAVSALTPSPSPTAQVIDRQPGERAAAERTIEELAAVRGLASTVSTRDGATVTIYDTARGVARQIELPGGDGIVATTTSADGGTIVSLRRNGARLTLETRGVDGAVLTSLDLSATGGGVPGSPTAATPSAATPAAATPVVDGPLSTLEAVTRDRLELSPDGTHLAVVSSVGDLSLVALQPSPSIVRVIRDFGDVSALGWTSDGQMALVGTYDRTRSTGSLTGVPLDGRLRSILRLPADDQRRIISVVAPTGSPDLFFVARSDADDWTAQNNLYRIPLAGGSPTVVVATGLAGPAGAVDRFAVADDGRTIAVTILIPRGDTLSFHSLWVTDIETARPLQAETGSLGLVTRLAWTPEGLFVLGVQRERSASASRLVTVALRLASDGTLELLQSVASPATPSASPAASPAASPVAGTPTASPAA